MKIPLIIREDGTAYRITLHKDKPELFTPGLEQDGFILYTNSAHLHSHPTGLWMLHEEFRKKPEFDLDLDYWEGVKAGLQKAHEYLKLGGIYDLAVFCSRGQVAITELKKGWDKAEQKLETFRAGLAGAPTPQEWEEMKRSEVTDMVADRLDKSGPILQFSREEAIRIWKRLLRLK